MSGNKSKRFISNDKFCENTRIQLPILVIEGVHDGPSVFICAGQHGREIHGCAAIASMYDELEPEQVSGKIIMVPFMNPLGVRMRSQDFYDESYRYLSTNKHISRDMNRMWTAGNPALESVQRSVVRKIYDECIVKEKVSATLDLHGWQPGAAAWTYNPVNLKQLFKLGLRMNYLFKREDDIQFTHRMDAEGIDAYSVEFSRQQYIDGKTFKDSCRVILNMLKIYGIIPGEPEVPEEQFIVKRDLYIKTPVTGIAVPLFEDLEKIKKGDEYIRIVSVENGEIIWRCFADEDAVNVFSARTFLGENTPPSSMVEAGTCIGHLAIVEATNHLTGSPEAIQEI